MIDYEDKKMLIYRDNKRVPVYLQIKDWIIENINKGVWMPHYKLPSEDDLAKQLNVARGTVRQALQELSSEKVIYRIHGKGTFVSPDQIEYDLGGEFLSVLDDLVKKQVPLEVEVLGQWIGSPPLPVASYLNLPSGGANVFSLKRLRKVNGSPIMLSENHVDYSLFPDIEKVDFNSDALYNVLEKKYGIRLDWAMRLFKAVPAEKEVADLLQIAEGAPIIFVEQLAYDKQGRCIDCAYLWFRSDKMELSVSFRRNKS